MKTYKLAVKVDLVGYVWAVVVAVVHVAVVWVLLGVAL